MKKLPFLLLIFLLGISLFTWKCGTKGKAYGEDDVIYVFADSSDWLKYEEPFNTIFGQFVRTPLMEPEYILVWKPFTQFEHYKNYKNIFIIGRLDSQDPVSQNVRELLNPEIIEGIESGNYFYIPKGDVYSLNQNVIFFVAESGDAMIQKIIDLGELAYQDFRKLYFRRLKKQMFEHMEQKELQTYLEKHFPFSIRIQHDYFIANENLQENFVWIRRLDPDRSLLIHWIQYDGTFPLNSRWVIDERNRLGRLTFSGDVIVEDETKAFVVQFKDWNAIRLEGTWKNDSLTLGGPFRNISFVDSTTQRIYMIDYYVQAIGKRKVPYLDQLNVIAHTFEVLEKPRSEEDY
ncbi:MAG: DUF4837 family protein [bacterium]|nr:MAG: DUF4837 family protein [bacterium]